MANLRKFDWEKGERSDEPNYKVNTRPDGTQYVIWEEDLDTIILNEDNIAELANALGYELVKKQSSSRDKQSSSRDKQE